MKTTYATVIDEIERLIVTGAVDRRGRRPHDPETREWAIFTRALSLALKREELPSEVKQRWISYADEINKDVLAKDYNDHARQSAYTRRKVAGSDSQLLTQAKANSSAKEVRLDQIRLAMAHVDAKGRKIKSKTVAQALIELRLPELKPDTIRKLLSEIRRGRAT